LPVQETALAAVLKGIFFQFFEGMRPVCVQFAMLPYTRVPPHLAQIIGWYLSQISLPGCRRCVASTRIRWWCRPTLSHLSACMLTGSFNRWQILFRRLSDFIV